MSALTVLSTDHVPFGERVGYWGDLIWRAFGRLRSDPYGDAHFEGRILQADLGAVRLCRLQASRHRVTRTAGATGASYPGFLKMVVQHRGHSVFEQDGRRATLSPGTWSLYDTTRSYSVFNPESVEQHVLLLPREPLLRDGGRTRDLLVRRLGAAGGMSRVACDTIRLALADAGRAGAPLRTELGAVILRLVRLALREQAGIESPHPPGTLLRERIRALLEHRLADPNLGPASIARALNCSKRTLHKAFEGESRSLHETIWDLRLDAARHALEGVRRRGTITDIAFACGFSSPAHFSRAFRARFGLPPRDWARRVVTESARPSGEIA